MRNHSSSPSEMQRVWRQARLICGTVALFIAVFWGVLFAHGWFQVDAVRANPPSYVVSQNQSNTPQIVAQQDDSTNEQRLSPEEAEAKLKAVLPIVLGASLFAYAFCSFALMKIADKTGVPNSWLAWIPVASLWVMCRAAGKPGWWLILFFVPIVNVVITFLIIFGMPVQLGKTSLLGLLVFVPVIGIFLYYGILAFT
ncbi:MAG: DUF5684 domain-containing protein [Pseudanabaena sp. ELA607]